MAGWGYVIGGGLVLYLVIFALCFRLNRVSVSSEQPDTSLETLAQ